ncbi:MAG: RNA polymerase sigma factor [Clostridia bacterium]|nr:RNA polymerase sigma factor [Clostridia bacterium]
MDIWQQRWQAYHGAVERYVHIRISSAADAEDVIQEVFSAAFSAPHKPSSEESFRLWLIGIARNKCADYFRKKYRRPELPLIAAEQIAVLPQRFARTGDSLVLDTLEKLSLQDQQILRLCYWQELPQQEIALRLGIPLGTVKSRLHHARERFRAAYPVKPKGVSTMKTIMPDKLPDYTITPSDQPPFVCRWEELMGWFIVPRLGERLSWAMYDFPDKLRTESNDLAVTGRAMIHHTEGVEIEISTHDPLEQNQTGDDRRYVQRGLIAQLTDTHCRILSETHTQNGIKQTYTYLDGDDFLSNWGFGPDNCGNEVELKPKGLMTRNGNTITTLQGQKELLDVVGRYTVQINGKTFDTVCLVLHEAYSSGTLSEQFIDRNGRTVLWRRFNADDWHLAHYGKRWSEMLPNEEQIIVNGQTYVHWYDCITSYIL